MQDEPQEQDVEGEDDEAARDDEQGESAEELGDEDLEGASGGNYPSKTEKSPFDS